MSKMSQLHAELVEHASELGFETLLEAEQAGFVPDYSTGKLVKQDYNIDKAYESRREEILNKLDGVIAYMRGTDGSDEGAYMIRELQEVEEYVKWV